MPDIWNPEKISFLEKRFLYILRSARLNKAFKHNHPVVGADGRLYYIDFAWQEVMLGIECDSKEYHGSERQQAHDQYRQDQLEEVGWTIIRFTSDEIMKQPEKVKSDVLKAAGEAVKKIRNPLVSRRQRK